MDYIGNYETHFFDRVLQEELVKLSKDRYYMTGLLEIDVTKAKKIFRQYKKVNGSSLSFTAWVVKCIAQAVSENKEVQAMRKGKKLYYFDDVDVSLPVEKIVDGKHFPSLHVIRKANEKSLQEIHDEIRRVQHPTKEIYTSEISKKKLKLLISLPKFVRKIFLWNRAKRNPLFLKKMNGTLSLSALGMFGPGKSGWGINLGHHSLCIVVGGISEHPRLIEGKLENREYLNLTVKFDHIIIDGGPATRFSKRVLELMENAEFLEEYNK
ncbi:MAG: 2-oxo acid dehydrogenase subunit E2 [Candidatus Heimdallarchaeaceae archaeon]